MTLPSDFPPKAGPARDAYILKAVDDGLITARWTPITSTANGHTATFYVLADALTLGGVRLSTSATLLQKIADKLGASLMTPRLLDLAHQQATAVIAPLPTWPNDDTTAAMVKHSSKFDAALDAISNAKRTLASPIGKNWVISNKLITTKPGHAALYGWAVAPEWKSLLPKVPLYPGTIPGIENIQRLATPHDAQYTDYAMLTNLVKRACIVDGKSADLWDVLRNPATAPLASHEGVLRVIRQPNVPVLAPLSPLGLPSDVIDAHLEPASLRAPSSHLPGILDVRLEPTATIKKSLVAALVRFKLVPTIAITAAFLAALYGIKQAPPTPQPRTI